MEDILIGDKKTAAGGGVNKETGILSLPHPLTILPGHLLMVAACAVEVTSPAGSRKLPMRQGCGKEEGGLRNCHVM